MVGIMDELEGEDTIHMQIHVHLPGFLLHYMGKLQDGELESFVPSNWKFTNIWLQSYWIACCKLALFIWQKYRSII